MVRKVCPKCGHKFLPEVETCPDCGVALEVFVEHYQDGQPVLRGTGPVLRTIEYYLKVIIVLLILLLLATLLRR